MTKTCNRCRQVKPLTDFNMNKSAKDGHQWQCRECFKELNRSYVLANAEQIKARKREHYKANAKHVREQQREYKQRTREQRRERDREYLRMWSAKHPGRMTAYAYAWQKRNPGWWNKRRMKGQQTPKWANDFFISEIYSLAKLRTEVTGIQWEVDHIVPLASPIVCGLHVEHNLRIVPWTVNRSKSNKFNDDLASHLRIG